jgi:DNA-3-methyladenine glycosylase I
MSNELIRCGWCVKDPAYIDYHDKEWGKPLHDDRRLFEMLLLEGAQAGLSWLQVLKRREAYRKAFDHFDAEKIARYDAKKRRQLMKDEGIIRNKLKINAFIVNAQIYCDLMDYQDSFNDYIWKFTSHKVLDNRPKTLSNIPATTPESDAMSKELKKRGFKFVGSTICYAYMQAVGMVNDHLEDCFVRSWSFEKLMLLTR